ncbi:MAG: hypothetical protein J7K81_00470 [Methanophagales archaeon]|nr:hypothetical protein [Methanophagales archaeon]
MRWLLAGKLFKKGKVKVINMQGYHYFVAHEFSRQEKDDLREAIGEAFKGTGLNAYYADLEVRPLGVQEYILEKIKENYTFALLYLGIVTFFLKLHRK